MSEQLTQPSTQQAMRRSGRLSRVGLLGLVLLLGACANHKQKPVVDDAPSPAEVRQKADLAWQYGDYGAAVDGYREILRTDPANRAALIGIGEAWLALGDSAHALSAFEEVLRVEPGAVDALEGRALARLGVGRDVEAAADFDAVLAQDAKRWRVLNGMGMFADLRGDYDAAQKWYEQALVVQPGEAAIWNNYGWSRVMAHDYVQAERLLSEAVARKPSAPRINANLAVAIAWQGDYERAFRIARRTAEEGVAYNDIGYIALLRGDTTIAAGYFQQAIDKSPSWFERAAVNLERAHRQAAEPVSKKK